MTNHHQPDPEVPPKKAKRRTFSAAYKRQIVAEAAKCQHGEIGALLRREGLYSSQLSAWRKAEADGTLGKKKRGPQANPHRDDMRRLEAENARLKRKLADAEAIIDAQKKLAALMERLSSEEEQS
jgi:transposase-like protein